MKKERSIPVEENGTSFPFPSENVDPELKRKDRYGLVLAKAIYYTISTFGPRLFNNSRSIYNEYISYAIGEQDENKYKPLLKIDANQSATTWVGALRWAIKNYATKRVNIAVSKISEREYDPIIDILDKTSIDKKNDTKRRLKFYLDFQDETKEIESITRQKLAPPEVSDKLMPETQEEIDLWMDTNFKFRESVIIEKLVKHHMDRNRYQNIKRKTAFDTFVNGAQIVYAAMDANMLPEIYRIDMTDGVFPSTEMEDFSDIGHGGHILEPTIPEFYKMVGDALTRTEVDALVKKHAKSAGTVRLDTSNNNNGREADEEQKIVPVFRFAYKSTNEMVHVQRKDEHGNPRSYRRKYDEFKSVKEQEKFKEKYGDSRTLKRSTYYSIYEGFYIIGSEIVFRYGEKHNQERPRGEMGQTALPYKMFAPNIQKNRLVSTMKQMIPVLDELQSFHIKKQHLLANALPAVWEIDLNAMRDAQFQWNDKDMTDQQKIQFLFQTGIFVYDSGDRYKTASSYRPIRNMANSVAADVMMYVNLIANALIELDEIIGYNKVTSASTLRPDTLKGTAEIQENASEVALDYLYRADREVTLEVIKAVAILSIQSVKYVKNGYYENILSSEDIALIKAMKAGDLGYRSEIRPTVKEWQNLYAEAVQAANTGVIGWDDYLDLKQVNNLKEAINLFRVRVRRMREDKQNDSKGLVQETGKVQQNSNEQAHKNKMTEIQMEKELQDAKVMADAESARKGHGYKMKEIKEKAKADTAGKIIQQSVQDESDQAKFVAEKVVEEFIREEPEVNPKKEA